MRRVQGGVLPEELEELLPHVGFDFRTISADLDFTIAVEGISKMSRAIEW